MYSTSPNDTTIAFALEDKRLYQIDLNSKDLKPEQYPEEHKNDISCC